MDSVYRIESINDLNKTEKGNSINKEEEFAGEF